MARWWGKLRGSEDRAKETTEASTSEEVFDSDMEVGDEDDFCESPTLVTVDDGKGGIKHIKVIIIILLLSYYYYFIITIRCPGRWSVRPRASSLVTTLSPGVGTRGPGAGAAWVTWSGRSWRENTSSTSSPTTRNSGRGSSQRRATSTSAR